MWYMCIVDVAERECQKNEYKNAFPTQFSMIIHIQTYNLLCIFFQQQLSSNSSYTNWMSSNSMQF